MARAGLRSFRARFLAQQRQHLRSAQDLVLIAHLFPSRDFPQARAASRSAVGGKRASVISALPSARDTAGSMSQENVEVAKAAYAAWNAGDMDAFRELCDPDIIMRPPERWPEPGPFVGREAVMREWKQVRETWVADAVEPIGDFIDAGDRVVVRQIWRGVGQGPESNIELTNVFTVRKGKIFFQEFFWDHAEALDAVGLSD